ncbi:MFS transporter [Flavobacterium ammonificans]|uniref:MFS transporter n=1 Tax=Flavobacterium ammonificans TaxID=1751056 RepID=A0ABM7UXX4_9FLAO|nr:MFS transporter [Flavobacterium ammonificans]BDB51897.1 MFS transporter [Flavobacterium ammonificans]
MLKKIKLNFWQIINMNVGFFGIQYSFGLQQSAVNPIYDFLGANPDQIPILNLAGPLTGLIIQPIIGAMSDKTWHPRWGRRKPYFFIGAMICSVALLLYPFSSSLWMAASLLLLLDVGNNTAMEPYRAFVADTLDEEQQPMGFQAQSFFTGFGQFLSYISLFLFPIVFVGYTGSLPNWIYASFFLGSVLSITSIWWSMRKTPEIPPTPEELALLKSEPLNIFSPFIDIYKAVLEMPKVMWQLFLVYLFQWYALMCYWQNNAKSIALSVWNTTPKNKSLYENAVEWNGLIGAFGFVITFSVAFYLAKLAKRYSPKLVHFACLVLAAICFLVFPTVQNEYLFFAIIIGYGIGWASMMGIPYLIIVNHIPKERYGVYMGIINMMIVIPMIFQNLTFGYILKNFLNNDARLAITFSGVLLLIGAACTLLIQSKKSTQYNN